MVMTFKHDEKMGWDVTIRCGDMIATEMEDCVEDRHLGEGGFVVVHTSSNDIAERKRLEPEAHSLLLLFLLGIFVVRIVTAATAGLCTGVTVLPPELHHV